MKYKISYSNDFIGGSNEQEKQSLKEVFEKKMDGWMPKAKKKLKN